jgi:hypothetical protein
MGHSARLFQMGAKGRKWEKLGIEGAMQRKSLTATEVHPIKVSACSRLGWER